MPVDTLPTLADQAERLIELGVHDLGGITRAQLRAAAATDIADALLVLRPDRAAASALVPLLRHRGRAGFVVVDMPDVDKFTSIDSAPLPEQPIYLVDGPERGDHMSNWSPNEALPAIAAEGRTPLTLTEGIHWLLQRPDLLERNRCFMTIGSRMRKDNNRVDSRTPAIWISNGTGRDGTENRNAPKVGWCWAGNRHTWLGFASAAARRGLPCAG